MEIALRYLQNGSYTAFLETGLVNGFVACRLQPSPAESQLILAHSVAIVCGVVISDKPEQLDHVAICSGRSTRSECLNYLTELGRWGEFGRQGWGYPSGRTA